MTRRRYTVQQVLGPPWMYSIRLKMTYHHYLILPEYKVRRNIFFESF